MCDKYEKKEFSILCITNRKLCTEEFLRRIEKIANEKPMGIVLREKDMSPKEYKELAKQVIAICEKNEVLCILHNFVSIAKELKCRALHVPLPVLKTLSTEKKGHFQTLGTSVHSVEEAMKAERLGCTYIIAGHIFETDCKAGIPGRGIGFLQSVCESVNIPVYAIGGIDTQNICQVRKAGAVGACVMSSIMTCDNLPQYLKMLNGGTNEI